MAVRHDTQHIFTLSVVSHVQNCLLGSFIQDLKRHCRPQIEAGRVVSIRDIWNVPDKGLPWRRQ
jgi:hypothetical protein